MKKFELNEQLFNIYIRILMSKKSEILFVEDNPGEITIIKSYMDCEPKVKINFVNDGISALDYIFNRGKYLNAIKPNLVVLDLNLPNKSGKEVLSELKSHNDHKNIPVIIFTSSGDKNDISFCRNLGVYEYYTKPMDLEEYYGIMKSICMIGNHLIKD